MPALLHVHAGELLEGRRVELSGAELVIGQPRVLEEADRAAEIAVAQLHLREGRGGLRPSHAVTRAGRFLASQLDLHVGVLKVTGREIELTEGAGLTRQGVSKHLRVLEDAGMVRSRRVGRESRFEFEPDGLEQARAHLEHASRQWDRTLARLKALVEER